MLLHKTYAFLGNIVKLPTPVQIIPYFQIIRITNHPLQPWIIFNLYMASHKKDLHLISNIQNTLTRIIIQNITHTIILCPNFNRNIALIGRHHDNHKNLTKLGETLIIISI
jgi:hypothetical protein